MESKCKFSDQCKTEATTDKALTHFIVDYISQGRREGKGNVNSSSIQSNRRETEAVLERTLTCFIVNHIDQGRMEGKVKVNASQYRAINAKQKQLKKYTYLL